MLRFPKHPTGSDDGGCSSAGSGLSFGVDPGWRGEPREAVDHVDGPVAVVDDLVVVSAEQGEVVEAGRSAGAPVCDVVGVATPRAAGAAGEGAAAVTEVQRPAHRVGD